MKEIYCIIVIIAVAFPIAAAIKETTESCNYDSIRIQDGPEFANTSHCSVEKVKNEK